MAEIGQQGPMLLAKKLGGLALVVLGLLGMGFGYESGSGWLMTVGVVALVVGVCLIALKIMRRNPG